MKLHILTTAQLLCSKLSIFGEGIVTKLDEKIKIKEAYDKDLPKYLWKKMPIQKLEYESCISLSKKMMENYGVINIKNTTDIVEGTKDYKTFQIFCYKDRMLLSLFSNYSINISDLNDLSNTYKQSLVDLNLKPEKFVYDNVLHSKIIRTNIKESKTCLIENKKIFEENNFEVALSYLENSVAATGKGILISSLCELNEGNGFYKLFISASANDMDSLIQIYEPILEKIVNKMNDPDNIKTETKR